MLARSAVQGDCEQKVTSRRQERLKPVVCRAEMQDLTVQRLQHPQAQRMVFNRGLGRRPAVPLDLPHLAAARRSIRPRADLRDLGRVCLPRAGVLRQSLGLEADLLQRFLQRLRAEREGLGRPAAAAAVGRVGLQEDRHDVQQQR